MEAYVISPEMLGVEDERVARTAAELTAPWANLPDKVWAIARFVREWVRLEVRGSARVARAPEVLCFLHGSATEKALLMSALCQASDITCRIAFQALTGAPAAWTALGPAAAAEWAEAHPVNEVLLGDRWVTVDVSLDSETASRLGLMMPALSGESDATLGEALVFGPEAPFRPEAAKPLE